MSNSSTSDQLGSIELSARLGIDMRLTPEEFEILKTGDDNAHDLFLNIISSGRCKLGPDTYFPEPWNEKYLDCDLEFVLPGVPLITHTPKSEIDQSDVPLVEQANELLDKILDMPNGDELFHLSSIIYKLQELEVDIFDEDLLALAQKTNEASLLSSVPLLTAERVDAVYTLLSYGLSANRCPQFPEASPKQMQELMLSCDIDTFIDLIDAVAIAKQTFYAPDFDYSLNAEASGKKIIDAIHSVVDKKTSLDNMIAKAKAQVNENSNPDKGPEYNI